jgi:DNA polymerase-4
MQIGIDNSEVNNKKEKPKGIGMSTTLVTDVFSLEKLEEILLTITEQVCFRLRKQNMNALVVNISLRTKDFKDFSHQAKMVEPTNSSKVIYEQAKKLLREMYTVGTPIRLIGIRVDKLSSTEEGQMSIFELQKNDKQQSIDNTLDSLKQKYGFSKISKASEINQNIEGKNLFK